MGDAKQAQRHGATFSAIGVGPQHAVRRAGAGVVIALADYGFDVLHPSFQSITGTTRFAALWDQNAVGVCLDDVAHDSFNRSSGPDGALLAGELEPVVLDRMIAASCAIGERSPVDSLYDPHANYYGRTGVGEGAHGTLMASIAAGSRVGWHSGVAPEATLLGVQLALPDSGWREEDASGNPTWGDVPDEALVQWDGWRNYDAAAATVAAIRYLYARARALSPTGIVINISLGTWAGAHDGKSPVERELAHIAALSAAGEGPPTVVVIGAGNAGNDQGHFAARVTPAAPSVCEWSMNALDPTQNKLEIWYRSASPVAFALSQGATTFALPVGPTQSLSVGGKRIGIFDHEFAVRDGLSRVRIILHPPYFAGLLEPGNHRSGDTRQGEGAQGQGATKHVFRLSASTQDPDGCELHAWLERDDGALEQSTLTPSQRSATLSCLAGATGAIVVGGFDLSVTSEGRVTGARRFPWASHGPLPWHGKAAPASLVPHLSAPAHGVVGARSKSAGFTYTSGTSAAAALVSGAAALILADAASAGRRATRDEVLAALVGRPNATVNANVANWDEQIGFGPLALAPPVNSRTDPPSDTTQRNEHAGTYSRA